MSTWGSPLWGGAAADTGSSLELTPVKDLLYHALRLAGVTTGPERVPSPAQYRDAVRAGNRMLGRWNTDGLLVPNLKIEAFPLTVAKKSYTMGPGGDFATVRPQRIVRANLIAADLRRDPLEVVEGEAWTEIRVQDQAGDPCRLYNDRAAGLVNLYLWPQPDQAGQQLEMLLWKLLERIALDDEIIWPEGYEEAFVYNLALRLAGMPFPGKVPMEPEVPELARQALSDIESLNAPAPVMRCDGAVMPSHPWGWSYDIKTNRF